MKRISDFFPPSTEKKRKSDSDTVEKLSDKNPVSSPVPSTSDPSNVTKRREFQQKWLSQDRYKNWLLYDEETSSMKCSVCIKTGKSNPFVTGCSNFRTSSMDRHMGSTEHINALSDKKDQVYIQDKATVRS